MRLCQRGRGGFRLTDKGQAVYEACRHLSVALESFRTTVGAFRGELIGDLSIGVLDNWQPKVAIPWRRCFGHSGPRPGPSTFRFTRWRRMRSSTRSWTTGSTSGSASSTSTVRDCFTRRFTTIRPNSTAVRHDPPFVRDPDKLGRKDVGAGNLVHRAYLSGRQAAPLAADLRSTASAWQIEGIAFLILSGWHLGYLPVSYAERWVKTGHICAVLPETFRLDTKIELVTRRVHP